MPALSLRYRDARRVAVIVMLAICAAFLSGCLRYTESLTIRSDDTVSGIIVIALRKPEAAGPVAVPSTPEGLQLPQPTSTSQRITVAAFDHEQESGYKVTFRNASFEDVGAFAPLGDKGGALKITRDGDTLQMAMDIDLTHAVNPEQAAYITQQAKATVALTVPGTIGATNGEVSGSTITWKLKPLEINSLEATVESPKGSAVSVSSRSVDLTRAGIIAAVLLALLALGWLLLRKRLREAFAGARDARTSSVDREPTRVAAAHDESGPARGARARPSPKHAAKTSAPAVTASRGDSTQRLADGAASSVRTDEGAASRAPVTATAPAPVTSAAPPDPFGGEAERGPDDSPSFENAGRAVASAGHRGDVATVGGTERAALGSLPATGGWPPPRPRWKEIR